jgi:hypothetical protein
MSDGAHEHQMDLGETEDKPEALRMCLQYLYREAMDANLRVTAHLIGAAAESIHCRCGKGGSSFDLSAFRGGTRQ